MKLPLLFRMLLSVGPLSLTLWFILVVTDLAPTMPEPRTWSDRLVENPWFLGVVGGIALLCVATIWFPNAFLYRGEICSEEEKQRRRDCWHATIRSWLRSN